MFSNCNDRSRQHAEWYGIPCLRMLNERSLLRRDRRRAYAARLARVRRRRVQWNMRCSSDRRTPRHRTGISTPWHLCITRPRTPSALVAWRNHIPPARGPRAWAYRPAGTAGDPVAGGGQRQSGSAHEPRRGNAMRRVCRILRFGLEI